MRGPNVADPRNPETIRKSNSTVALTRQAMHDGSVPRVPRAAAAKSGMAYDAAAPVADIKVDAPGSRPQPLLAAWLAHERCQTLKGGGDCQLNPLSHACLMI